MSYQTGALDTTLVNGEQVDQVKDDPEFTTVGAGYLWYVSPNMNSVPELANLNIRLAMTMAIDRDSITADVLKDGSASTYTAVPMQFAQVLTDLTSPKIRRNSLMCVYMIQKKQQITGQKV